MSGALFQSAVKAFPGCPAVYTGLDAYQAVPGFIKAHGGKALLLGGEKAMAAALPALQEALAGSGALLDVRRFFGECTTKQAESHAQTARESGAGILLGMGGGKALDTAKAAAHLAGLPVLCLPTIPATCAAVTALCVLHDPPGEEQAPFIFMERPPLAAFLHTGVLAAAPHQYLRAGIGDSLTKAVESAFKAKGRADLSFYDQLGLSVARFGYDALLREGEAALRDAARGLDSAAFRLVTQACVVNTGLVSLMVHERLNGALAHSLFYALRGEPAFEQVLHGDAVAWGSLVLLTLDGKKAEARALKAFLRRIGAMDSLAVLGRKPAQFKEFLPLVLAQPDMAELPYPVDASMILSAMESLEALGA